MIRFRPGARSARSSLGVGVTLFTIVTACAPAPKQAQHSVDDYRSHADLRRQMLARCTNDPGGTAQDPDCVNAREAARVEGIGSLRTLPPLGLPAAPARRNP